MNQAKALYDAWSGVTEVDAFTGADALDLAQAYAVQKQLIELRTAQGEHLTGIKLGFTSTAKMRQMGVSQVIAGELTTGMAVADGGTINSASLIHPRVEPEVVFRLGKDITPELGVQGLSSAVNGIAIGLEIIDSRYRNFKFTLEDVIADNASAAYYAVGPWVTPTADLELSLANRGVVLQIDGQDVDSGSTAAILDNPWRALRAAVFHAKRYGITLRAGQIILAGAATAAHPLPAGSVARAQASGLGSVSVRMSDPVSGAAA